MQKFEGCVRFRRSVSVERRTRDAPPASSAQENPESIQESPESIQGNPESIQANPKSILKKPMYVFTPVDKFGDNKGSTCELEDKGNYVHYHIVKRATL